jgi:Mn-dependent DtxR family transcriptional regulator
MENWKQFDANEVTHSVSHHLLAIYELGREYGGWARVSDIARRLDITRGSVSINLRGIKARGLVVEDDHRQVKLSSKGLKIAHDILAKKTAIKAFLQKVLGLSEEQAEVDSCKIEHLLSAALAERLVHFMKLMLSDDAAARALLGQVRKFKEPCRDGAPCPVCKDRCLLEQLSPVLEGPTEKP